jgi:hypothetical protein
MITLRIVGSPGDTLVGEIGNYTGPVPRPGEYIYHPPLRNTVPPSGVMSVKTVTYHLLEREQGCGCFVGRVKHSRVTTSHEDAEPDYLIEVCV